MQAVVVYEGLLLRRTRRSVAMTIADSHRAYRLRLSGPAWLLNYQTVYPQTVTNSVLTQLDVQTTSLMCATPLQLSQTVNETRSCSRRYALDYTVG